MQAGARIPGESPLRALTERYLETLRGFVRREGEDHLAAAYEIGRESITAGLGMLDMAAIHQHALSSLLREIPKTEEQRRTIERAAALFNESIAPYEMALLGFVEANEALRQLNETLERRVDERTHQLRESEERHRQLFENVPVGLFSLDSDGRVAAANPALLKILGYPNLQVLASDTRLAHFADAERLAAWQQRLRAQGLIERDEDQIRREDGVIVWTRSSVRAVSNAQGGIARIDGTLEDITERRRADDALRASEERFSKIFRASPIPILLMEQGSGNVVDLNGSASRFLGWSREEAVGRTGGELGLWARGEDREGLVRQLEQAGTVQEFAAVLVTSAKAPRDALVFAERVHIGGKDCMLLLLVDVTEKQAVERYRENLLDVISHEFRTPVTVIQGYAELISNPAWSPGPEKVQETREKIQRASRLLGYLLYTLTALTQLRVHGAGIRSEAIEVEQVVRQACEAVEALRPGSRPRLEVQVAPPARQARADPRKLVIALVALLDNALKFSPPGSPVAVRADTEGEWLRFSVADQGPGMPESVTKEIGKAFVQADMSSIRKTGGLGLGLTLVDGLVRAHGGKLRMESHEGRGTMAKILLPLEAEGEAGQPR